jgi:hypothetical protein
MQLAADSRASMRPTIPPSYSAALGAPVPSEVYDMVRPHYTQKSYSFNSKDAESTVKQFEEDSASLARVTFTTESQPPPSYDEARQRAMSNEMLEYRTRQPSDPCSSASADDETARISSHGEPHVEITAQNNNNISIESASDHQIHS